MDTSLISDDLVSNVSSTRLETNLDDFSMATFVPAPYQTAEAKTRKISKAESVPDKKVKTADTKMTRKVVLKERVDNSYNKSSVKSESAADVTCHSKKTRMLSEEEIDTITKIHTICNGQRTVQYLDLNDIPLNFKHFPPPKRASKVVWNHDISTDEKIHHTPQSKLPSLPRPILQQKPKDFTYPYKEDEPSPIVITKVRRMITKVHHSHLLPGDGQGVSQKHLLPGDGQGVSQKHLLPGDGQGVSQNHLHSFVIVGLVP
ncbi:unnamed protein product [Mytilus edulis]|uniref:Uncharacterized protein n=1 Tax=Mytilus edulis TaxID=6550 RepID=A0A8S3UU33_MYTED|nr:unnamed protein product [Mytilus edulis]